jgi:hypothetical protein
MQQVAANHSHNIQGNMGSSTQQMEDLPLYQQRISDH